MVEMGVVVVVVVEAAKYVYHNANVISTSFG
jgi:predicted short-subunit dehydrogenase-like oxidoreductase (DUF2520 family)